MANQYGLFWNSENNDRVYDADSFSEWLGKFFTTGVFNGELKVSADSGMSVKVGTGYANINGKVRFFDQVTYVTVAAADGTYPRIDAIAVRADAEARQITIVYKKGSYSGTSPAAPAPTRSGNIYEIILAHLDISAGTTQIRAANITDTRANKALCGWVTGTVDHVAVEQLTEQAQADFMEWFDRMKDQLSEDAAGNLQLQIDDHTTRISTNETDISALKAKVGTATLSTDNKNLCEAVNEIHTRVGKTTLNTTAKNLTAAMNEVHTRVGTATLKTTAKNALGAINEIHTRVGTATLKTSAQNLMAAVNELKNVNDTQNTSISTLNTTTASLTTNLSKKADKNNAALTGFTSAEALNVTTAFGVANGAVAQFNGTTEFNTPIEINSGTAYVKKGNYTGEIFVSTNGTLSFLSDSNWLNLRSKQQIQCVSYNNDNTFIDIYAKSFQQASSRRYKERIANISDDIANTVNELHVKKYDYKEGVVDEDSRYNRVGLIAEEVAEIIPEVVGYKEDDSGKRIPDSVDYSALVPYLLKTIQVQEKKTEALSARLDAVEKKIGG